ncbi:MAG: Undecaprenyl phosphate-alpha-4-amino-4-deoxy-L-arabinose arabinosyl transferase [Syntrophorhabdus sp. PtaU1.Bin050]|nr:MAG: Undecaprenyl phosphate-alpha-4-amino-4-deoxy-L-arabinose arabinosyl transferase [Syntrophorhabdus sp. PtaU1.Bin050]
MTDRNKQALKYLLLLLIIVVPLFSLGLSNHGLWSADEPRVAEIGREMALTGNWAVPMLNQRPFLEEPPLYYGALALTFKAFGEASDKVARIPSALFAFATVLALFFLTNSIFGPRVALLSGIILATTGEYYRVAHWVIVDNALTFFVVSAMALFITGYLSENNRRKLLCYILVYVAATLAFYSKGFIGIVIPGLGILAFLALERNFKEILRMRLWLGVLIFLVMTLPWFMALWQQAGTEHLNVFFVHNHLQRFLPAGMAGRISADASGHHHPFYYYLTEFPNGFLPWSILLIPVLCHAFSKSGQFSDLSFLPAKGRLFAKCWFFAGIIFLSIASTKRTLYLLPIFAPFSLLTALYINSTIESGSLDKIGKIFLWVFDILLLVIGIALTPVYLYLKKTYLQALPADLPLSVLATSVLVTAIAFAGAFSLQRRNLVRYWISINLPVVLVLIFTLVSIVPILDKYKSFVPFSSQVTALVPADQPLYAYQPDETLRGAVPFYTGRFVVEAEEIGKDLFSKEDPFYIMIRDKKEAMEKELLSTTRLHILVKQPMGSDRALVLFSNRPTQKTIMIGETLKKVKKDRTHVTTAP